jgi:predicted CoA-substrate-specific enzyme activase
LPKYSKLPRRLKQNKGRTKVLFAGIDVGAATAKVVILCDGKILSYAIIPTGFDVINTANEVARLALEKVDHSVDELEFVIATGYARSAVPFANKTLTEILCHAKGVHLLLPRARTIIDIGGQDSKVIRVDESGNVINFNMNDKCAAGTGRFFEVMAVVLGLDISEMGPIALNSRHPCQISSTCTVFAETEVVSLRAQGRSREDLISGIHKAAALRVVTMGKTVGYEKEVVLTGGVAKNIGVKKFLEDEIKMETVVPEEPQIMGALGAALFAQAELGKK